MQQLEFSTQFVCVIICNLMLLGITGTLPEGNKQLTACVAFVVNIYSLKTSSGLKLDSITSEQVLCSGKETFNIHG